MAKQTQPSIGNDPAITKTILAQINQAGQRPITLGSETVYPAAVAQVNGSTVTITSTGNENDLVTLTTNGAVTVNSFDQITNNYKTVYGITEIVAGNNITTTSNIVGSQYAVTVNATVGSVGLLNLDGNVSNVLRGDGTFSADANSSYGNSNVTSLLGAFGSNTISTTGIITANGANLSNVPYANLTGAPSLGNISSINLDGNASNVLRGDGTFSADANSSYGNSNVVSLLGSFGSNTISTTGNVSTGNITTTVTANAVGAGATVGVRSTLNVDSSFGSTDPNNPASAQGVRGRISGSNLTGNSNYLTGVTGQYLITGTNASDFIKSGVLGVVGDQTTTADAAVVAYLDGDGGLTTANAAYAVGMKNSTPGSGFTYGLDLQLLDFGLGLTSPYSNADIRLNNGVEIQSNTSGVMTVVGNITTTENVTALNIINTVTTYANLPAATLAGIRAFISDANLVASGNFGATVGSGGSNTVPVYSDGANWCIG